VEKYVDDTGIAPATVLMAKARLGNLFLNAEMRAAAAANGVTPARVNRETIDAIFAANDLPPISTYDVKVRVNNVSTRVWPEDKVALLPDPSENMGNTFYGITAEALKLRGLGYIDSEEMPGIVAAVTTTDSPVQTFTVGTAIALPVLPNPMLLFIADVAS
jgi:Phage major capsid protein E